MEKRIRTLETNRYLYLAIKEVQGTKLACIASDAAFVGWFGDGPSSYDFIGHALGPCEKQDLCSIYDIKVVT